MTTARWYGVNFPFYGIKTTSGLSNKVLARQEDYKIIRNDFIQGLMTIKGERWFRPNFGGNIPSFLFDPKDSFSKNKLEASIIEYVRSSEDRIRINKIDVQNDPKNDNAVTIKIYGQSEYEATSPEKLLAEFLVPIAGAR